MQPRTGRVWKHIQYVVFGFMWVDFSFIQTDVFPVILPLFFDFLKGILRRHLDLRCENKEDGGFLPTFAVHAG